MSFKLLAIRPMKGCGNKFLKNLQINCIYKFYEEAIFFAGKTMIESYEDVYAKEVITKIEFDENKSVPKGFFYDEKISVSAIVGKNGSGKSSLIDLLVGSINQLAYKKSKEKDLNTTAELIYLKGSEKICCELYYKSGEEYYILKVDDKDVTLQNLTTYLEVPLNDFFYTNIVNYSIHSNNSNEVGRWIDRLFHKNDSYQIPVVINPKRENSQNKLAGIIDINNENFLVIQRLFSLLIENPKYPISENLKIDKVAIKYKPSKNFMTFVPSEPKLSKNYRNEEIKKSEFEKYFNDQTGFAFSINKKTDIKRYYYGISSILNKFKKLVNIDHIELGENQYRLDIYIVYKIISICEKYPFFDGIIMDTKSKANGTIISASFDFEKFAVKYKSTDTHIVVKLKQIVNYIKNYNLLWEEIIIKKRIDLSLLSDQLKSTSVIGKSLIEKLPPPVLDVKFLSSKNVDVLSRISSGEKQLIHSISSILYHVTNLNSVEEAEVIIKYENINIILDEIELYFHPEFQRCFLDRLLQGLTFINTSTISGINIVIISHSPFILSDIPKQNVLFLKSEVGKSKPQKYDADNTFGENIHEILSNGFFLADTKGEFAKKKIEKFLKFYFEVINVDIIDKNNFKDYQNEYLLRRDDFKKLVNLVGENYIREILQNHIFELDRLFISSKMLILDKQRIIDKLQSEIKSLNNG